MILLADGRVMTVGSNTEEQIGEFVGFESLAWFNVGAYSDVTQISCGPYTSMFIRTDGTNEYVKLFGSLLQGPSHTVLVFKSYAVNP
jgi:hypothetical protein